MNKHLNRMVWARVILLGIAILFCRMIYAIVPIAKDAAYNVLHYKLYAKHPQKPRINYQTYYQRRRSE